MLYAEAQEGVDWAFEISLETLLSIPCRSYIAGNLLLTSHLATIVPVAIFSIL